MAQDVDALLDTLTGILRDFGRHSFDLERQGARKTHALFDQWAQHFLTGVAPPSKGPVSHQVRAHQELRQQFLAHRRQEQTEVTNSQEALRDVVWMFVSSLSREAAADQNEDAQLGKTLEAVSASIHNAAPSDMRRLALEAVREVQGVLASRRERQHRKIAELAVKLEALGSHLAVPRTAASLDEETQLYNRRAFEEHLARVVELSALRPGGVALMLFGLDSFERSSAGEALMKAVVQCCIRAFKGKDDFIARYEQSVLAVVTPEVTHVEAQSLAERFRESVERVQTTVSCGVATWQRGEPASVWVKRAEGLLQLAQHEGSNRAR
jgi:diguanylate cyclase (GGDEF)-like protein